MGWTKVSTHQGNDVEDDDEDDDEDDVDDDAEDDAENDAVEDEPPIRRRDPAHGAHALTADQNVARRPMAGHTAVGGR